MLKFFDLAVLGWIALSSLYAFALFAWDKSRSRQSGKSRTSEIHLLTASALGGLPGALAGMLIFRHKTAKLSFKLKFAIAFLIWSGLLWVYWSHLRP